MCDVPLYVLAKDWYLECFGVSQTIGNVSSAHAQSDALIN